MGPASERRDHPHRRGADTGQLAILAAGPLSTGRTAAVVRQAVPARLAGDDWLGQELPPAGAACRGRRTNADEVSRSAATADGSGVNRSLTIGPIVCQIAPEATTPGPWEPSPAQRSA